MRVAQSRGNVSRKENELLQSTDIETMVTLVEEAARSTEKGIKRFIEPAHGTLRRAVSKRHHLIFGRRGSGKSSLLRKAAADLTVDRRPIAYVDMEPFKAHSYPDVLLSVLIKTFSEFEHWLVTAAVYPANRASFWKRLFGSVPGRSIYKKTDVQSLAQRLHLQIDELREQLHAQDDVDTETTYKHTTGKSAEAEATGKIGLPSHLGGEAKLAAKNNSEIVEENKEKSKRSKTTFLNRHIMDYQQIFRDLGQVCEGDSFLFLDDLYHIRKADQPSVIDYFHRIAKNNSLWLKIGTIRHRSRWYVNGDPPMGLKTSDDADEIDLDLTLEKFDLTKHFLVSVLQGFATECGLDLNRVLNEGAIDRLTLASGGVARDFLAIFRKAVDVARQRGEDYRGVRIGSEDVNVAAGEHEPSKREELKRDTLEDQVEIVRQFDKVVHFCLERAEANVFLLDKSATGHEWELIQELVDLRLIHLVRSRITLRNESGRLFEGYMLDLSQYAGARKRRDFEIVKFWESDSADQLRRMKLIYTSSNDTQSKFLISQDTLEAD
jgi:hypothetical protein